MMGQFWKQSIKDFPKILVEFSEWIYEGSSGEISKGKHEIQKEHFEENSE